VNTGRRLYGQLHVIEIWHRKRCLAAPAAPLAFVVLTAVEGTGVENTPLTYR
jgi:hypothetical protein